LISFVAARVGAYRTFVHYQHSRNGQRPLHAGGSISQPRPGIEQWTRTLTQQSRRSAKHTRALADGLLGNGCGYRAGGSCQRRGFCVEHHHGGHLLSLTECTSEKAPRDRANVCSCLLRSFTQPSMPSTAVPKTLSRRVKLTPPFTCGVRRTLRHDA
jgi:hypothetical protein